MRVQKSILGVLHRVFDAIKNHRPLVIVLSAVVVFAMTYCLILPASALDKNTAETEGGTDVYQASESQPAEEAQAESDSENAKDVEAKEEKKDNKDDNELYAETISYENRNFSMRLDCGSKAELPADTELHVEEIASDETERYQSYREAALETLKEELEKDNDNLDTQIIKLYDVSLTSDGEKVEPTDSVDVEIDYYKKPSVKKEGTPYLVHITEDEDTGEISAELVDEKDVEVSIKEAGLDKVSFTTESFSVYGIIIVDELPEGDFITKTYEDEAWLIKTAYKQTAAIPDEAELRVSELTHKNDPESYEENADMVFNLDDQAMIYSMLDIGFWTGDTEVEPQDTVYVTIRFKDEERHSAGDVITVYHREDEKLSCVSAGELNENLETTYEVNGFSLFIITDQGEIQWVQWTTATSNYDPDWVSRGGTVRNFTNNLPLGTAAITKSMAVTNRSSFSTTNRNRFRISGNYVQCNLTKPTGSDTYYDDTFTVTWEDAVTLQDGTTADLVVTGKNLRSRNASGWKDLFSGGAAYVHAAWGGISIDLNYSVQKNGEIVQGYTLLFGTTDIDQPDRCQGLQYYQVTKAIDGRNDLIAYALADKEAVTNSTYIRYSEPLTEQDAQQGKIQLANASKQRLYWTDDSETEMTTDETEWPVYAVYKVYRSGRGTLDTRSQTAQTVGSENRSPITKNVYVTREPVEYAEAVSISGLKSKVYIPDHNFLHFDVLNGMYRASSIANDSSGATATSTASGTAATGFFALVDSAGYTIRYTGSADGIGIGLTSSNAYYKVISTTGIGGDITTTDTDISGNRVTYGPGLLAVPKGKTVPYTMTPETFYHAKTVSIWDVTQVAENRSVIPIGDMLDDEAWIDVEGEEYTQKTVTVPYKDESDEYAKNPPAGTENEITYVLRRDSTGMITGYRSAESIDPDTGETTGTLTPAFTYKNGVFTDSVRNVSYGITVDANGVLQYTFANVQANHWIDVRWEKDPPQEAVILIKEWVDNGNARQARPDHIVMHLVSENGVKFSNGKTELVTGTDSNINGNTEWVKDGDRWIYTFNDIPSSATFAVYEETVSDYYSANAGFDHKKTVTEYTETKDDITGEVTRTYTVTLSNTLQAGSLEFTKVGERKNSDGKEYDPLAGAVFALYTDAECLYPVIKMTGIEDGQESGKVIPVTATSDANGKVSFSGVPCGMYYMKETEVSGDYASNSTLYQVKIHADGSSSTITVVTPDADGSGVLEGDSTNGYTIKNILAKFDVILVKVSMTNNQLRLPSAKFVLYGSDYVDENGHVNEHAKPLSSPIDASKWYDKNIGTSNNTRYGNIADESAGTFYSSRNGNKNALTSVYGRAPLGALKSGTYYLVELEPPAGYEYPNTPITIINVGQNGVTAMPHGGVSPYTVSYTINNGVYTYTVAVPNTAGVELPSTGGSGTRLFTILAACLIAMAGLLLWRRRRLV